jgi:hypothetical protein
MHISGTYTEADRFKKISKAGAVVRIALTSDSSHLFTSSMTLEIAPESTAQMWQVKGGGKDRDGSSTVKGLYNSTNGRCERLVFVLSEATILAESFHVRLLNSFAIKDSI